MRFLFLSLLLLNVASAAASSAPSSCDERREHLLSLLREGVKRTQRRAQEIRESTVLSEMSRGDFQQSAEWLIAWLRDQAERLEGLPSEAPHSGAKEGEVACELLPQIAQDAYEQVLPLHVRSLRASASLLIWELDQLLQEERVAAFEEARMLLRQALEEEEVGAVRLLLRRAAFKAHSGLRMMRSSGIME